MAAFTKSTKGVSLASTNVPPNQRITGLVASESIVSGDACKITAAGVAKAMGADVVDGFALTTCSANEPVTLFWGVNARYADNATAGVSLYLSTTVPGGLDTTANGKILARTLDNQRVALSRGY